MHWKLNSFLMWRQGSNVDRLRAELAVEFREALLHAYHGPAVDMSARRLPAAFEADERSDGASPDILQLLSGRCVSVRFSTCNLGFKKALLPAAFVQTSAPNLHRPTSCSW